MRAAPPGAGRTRLLRHLVARPRLLAGIAGGAVVALLLPAGASATLRAIVGWDCGIVLFLALTIVMAARAVPQTMRRRAAREDESRWVFLALVAGAAFFSMFAILGLMREAKAAGGDTMIILGVLAGVTILLSWLLAHTMFGLHYAHDYFNDLADGEAGLAFPGEASDPDYWDFLYFSLVVGMTAQVSDVQVLTQPWRRLVLVHGLLSFLFNTLILALSINLLAGFF